MADWQWMNAASGPVWLADRHWQQAGIIHGFFTRRGGVSTGLYDSLNGGIGSGDDPQLVARNRALAAAALGLDPDMMASLYQVHGNLAVQADPARRPEADGLVTSQPGQGLMILAADCVPVLLADHGAAIVAACHAGWRGALAGIVGATVSAMIRQGARPDRISARIGPAIAGPSYQIDQAMHDRLLAEAPHAAGFLSDDLARPGRYLFHLPGFVAEQAARAGLTDIADCRCDTYLDQENWFSHRRATHNQETDSGRLMAIIALRAS